MKRAMVPLAVAGLVLSALGLQFSSSTLSSSNAVAPRITQSVDENQRVVLKGNTHPLARSQFDHGAAPADLPLNRMLLVLKRSPEQESALRQLLDEQQDKSSPTYHKWLTPDEFGKKFGPADQDIQVTTNWLQQHGFQIGKVARGRTVIEFSGTAAQVQEAFGTSIHKYVVKGKEHWANANDPQAPAALAPVISGIFTMHDFRKKPMLKVSEQRVSGQYVQGHGFTTFPGNPPLHALSPADYATIYNLNGAYQQGINGTGETIAIVGRSDLFNDNSDIGNFNFVFGTSAHAAVLFNGPDPGDLGGGEEAEATLDTAWSAALAPGAFVYLVASASTATTDGVDLSELYIIDNNLADVMSESFGTCELPLTQSEKDGISALAEQAAAQGITYTVSAGDSGAEGCDDPNSEIVAQWPLSVNVLASTPFTVAVGGTMFNEGSQASRYWNSTNNSANLSSALSYIPENTWNESCTTAQCGANANIWAGGGGASGHFPKPSWQAGVNGIPNDNARDLPDVSLTAAGHDPYLLCLEGSCVPDSQGFISLWAVSGTSASAPSFAAIMALVDQKMGGRQGQANYVLYKLAAQNPATCNGSNTSTLPTSNCIFNDTTIGNNAVPGESGYGTSSARFQSGPGYDLATGLGSVNVNNLVNKWSSAASSHSTTTSLVVSPQVFTHGSLVSVQITVTSTGGIPTGDVSLLMDSSPGFSGASFNLCASGCTLSNGSLSTTTRILRGGNYYVHAHFAGDGNFAASDSYPSVLLTVSPEGSNTTVGVVGTFDQSESAPYGTLVQLQSSVSSQSGYGIPSGVVNFVEADSSQVAGDPYLLNNLGTTATLHGLFTFDPGMHTITANYSGDSSFNASSSAASTPFTITLAPTASQATVTGAVQGATLATAVTSSSGGIPPSGNVDFYIDGNKAFTTPLLGSSPLINPVTNVVQVGASGSASWLDSALANGQHTLLVAYAGDTRYTAASSSVSFNLQPDFTMSPVNPSKITIPSPGGAGSLSFSVGALDGFTGTVNFSCSGLPAESACNFSPTTVKGSGTTILTVTSTPPKSSRLAQPHHLELWAAGGSFGIVGVFLLGVPTRRKHGRRVIGFAAFLILLAALGCGGGGGGSTAVVQHDPGTTPGTYNVTINASSGSLVHHAGFQLVIQ